MLQLVFASCFTKTVDGKHEYAFGLENGLPWGHIKQDMKNFKARTEFTILLMGAKTWESLDKPLSGRRSIVVTAPLRGKPRTKNGETPNEIMYYDEFGRFLKGDVIITASPVPGYPWNSTVCRNTENVSIIGGKSLIEQAVPVADKIVTTSIIKSCRVNSDVQLDESLYHVIHSRCKMIENHWYYCDELTHITESVWVPKD